MSATRTTKRKTVEDALPNEAVGIAPDPAPTDPPHGKSRTLIPIILWVSILLCFSLTLYSIPPETLIAHIGVSNAYLLILVLSFLGGVMTFSGVPYHIFLVSFVLSGMNPLLLGITAGVGVAIGDVTSYFLGYYGRVLLPVRMERFVAKVEHLKERHPRILPVIFFLYSATIPYSNDVFTIPLGIVRYPFFRLMIPLMLGSTIFNITLALLAAYAYDLIKAWF